jgi:hypothetical protein
MADIQVTRVEAGETMTFDVAVREGGGATQHRVTLRESDYQRLAGETTPEALVEESFRFLLEREPKEAILRRFNLMVISNYFPEYEREIKGRIAGG